MAVGEAGRQRSDRTNRRGMAPWREQLVRYVMLSVVALVGLALLITSLSRAIGLVDSMLAEGDDFTPYWNGAVSVAAGQNPYGWLAEGRPRKYPITSTHHF
jgi:hypothetical protein